MKGSIFVNQKAQKPITGWPKGERRTFGHATLARFLISEHKVDRAISFFALTIVTHTRFIFLVPSLQSADSAGTVKRSPLQFEPNVSYCVKAFFHPAKKLHGNIARSWRRRQWNNEPGD